LLQHSHNPVDWFPWGPEAFERARAEAKPIFLSVGYSACHWCHVMERESFEDERIAEQMNRHFINVKVDREERPDVDQVYMAAVQAMNGHGGWPMSVFLTPDRRPFYGGTYFPPADRMGMPGFPRVLSAVADAWANRREEIAQGATHLTEQLAHLGQTPTDPGPLSLELLDNAFRKLSQLFDPRDGGFGDAPKFPHPMDIRVLLRHHQRTRDPRALAMARLTLDKMARGGIYDHLGGGFARYSTDSRWLVPHFEKMLYDNALLATTYLEAHQLTHDPFYARVARETLDYVLGRMSSPSGGLYSTEDADSEGVEGKYYVWTYEEISAILGAERARVFNRVYDVAPGGNWEHRSILNLPRPLAEAAIELGTSPGELEAELAADRRRLLEARDRRVPPGKDTKILAAWNGLMIAALACGSRVLRDHRYLDAARGAADFLLSSMRDSAGRLQHVFKDGQARVPAFLDDHACVIDALARLFEVTGEARWLESALDLARTLIDRFRDAEHDGFYFTAEDQERLIVRSKDATDNATPAGNAMAASALLRLAALTSRSDLEEAALGALRSARAIMAGYPSAAGQSLIALDFALAPRQEVVVCEGADPAEFHTALDVVFEEFTPRRVVAPVLATSRAAIALVQGRTSRDDQTTAYVCENQVCQAPAVGIAALRDALEVSQPPQA
jgi:uncharacterized protein YyaL (SSP411 family)